MLNFNRRDQVEPPRDSGKPTLKSSLYNPATPPAPAPATPAPRPATQIGKDTVPLQITSSPSAPAPARDTQPAAAAAAKAETATPAAAAVASSAVPELNDAAGSKLCVGVNIKLRGVEISDCDVLVIEGQVDATVHSKVMQISRPGTLKGTANIDVAEIDGDFTGELTARTRLIVHSTGRVSGTIRYGKLVVEEGGELTGDVKRLDATTEPIQAVAPPMMQRPGLRPEREIA